MQISVLGPLRVTVAGREVRLPAKQQVLLAILALQPGRTVSTDRLIAALWGEDASPGTLKTLQSHMFQLRRLLTPDPSEPAEGSTIVTDGRGYRLAVDTTTIDAKVFERLFDEGRTASTADPRRALAALEGALATWRGPSPAEVGDEPVASAESERLTELRAAAFDQLIRVRFALGRYDQAIPELRREVRELPFREQLWANLMVALVRDGRKAEALIAYRDAEAALRQELDVEPSLELQTLATRIRDGDASLARPEVSPVVDEQLPSADGSLRRSADSVPMAEPMTARPRSPIPIAFSAITRHKATTTSVVVIGIAAVSLLGVSIAMPRTPGVALASPSPYVEAFPDGAERDLLARLPAKVTDDDTCSRSPAAERTNGAIASVRCDLAPGSGADSVWYEVLEPPGAVRQRYLDPVHELAIDEGDCKEDARAWQEWPVPLRGTFSGHIVCYRDTDGARLLWSYDALGVLARARRPDGDSAELWRWWTGVGPFLRY